MHVRRALALTLAVPVLLAGCSDDPEPKPKIPETTSSSPTPTKSETPEAESPEDFIRRWVKADQQMFATGDTRAFLAMGPDCSDCRDIAATVDRIYEGGGTVRWHGWKILELEGQGKPNAHAYRFVVNSAPTRYREAASGPWKTLEGGRVVQFIKLEPVGSSWQVLESRELPK